MQVGSHYPFFEVNPKLSFDREKAFGCRLDIPAGTAVRFEPGESRSVQLIPLAGSREVYGGNALTNGPADSSRLEESLERAVKGGFAHAPEIPKGVDHAE